MIFDRLLDYRSRDQLVALSDSGRLALLREILLKGPLKPGWEAILELFATWPDNRERLEAFDLAETKLATWDDDLRLIRSSLAALYEGENLSPLARLARSIQIYRREERGSAELIAIASSRHVYGLKRLVISSSFINDYAWSLLVRSEHLSGMRQLEIFDMCLTSDHVDQLLNSSGLRALESLRLAKIGLKGAWLERTARSACLSDLRHVDLSHNFLYDEGASFLSSAPWMKQVHSLNLQDDQITAHGIEALLRSPVINHLREADFSDNRILPAEKSTLAKLADSRGIQIVW